MNGSRILGTGTFISIGSPVVTEIVSGMGYDWLLFDMEHGSVRDGNLLENLMAVRTPSVKSIVRVPEGSRVYISRALDQGAAGIMIPHVSAPEKAENAVDLMYYPPRGSRGFSTSVRAMDYGMNPVKDTLAWEPPLLLAQIEDKEGVDAAEEIASVDGVDVLFVGPRDMSLDLSVRKDTMDFDEALLRVVCAAKKYGRQAGILVRDPSALSKYKSMGFTAIAIGSDMGALKAGYKLMSL